MSIIDSESEKELVIPPYQSATFVWFSFFPDFLFLFLLSNVNISITFNQLSTLPILIPGQGMIEMM